MAAIVGVHDVFFPKPTSSPDRVFWESFQHHKYFPRMYLLTTKNHSISNRGKAIRFCSTEFFSDFAGFAFHDHPPVSTVSTCQSCSRNIVYELERDERLRNSFFRNTLFCSFYSFCRISKRQTIFDNKEEVSFRSSLIHRGRRWEGSFNRNVL